MAGSSAAAGHLEREGGLERRGCKSSFSNDHCTEMCCGNEAGSYLRLIDSCFIQLQAQDLSRTCNESEEEEEVNPKFVAGSSAAAGDLEREGGQNVFIG